LNVIATADTRMNQTGNALALELSERHQAILNFVYAYCLSKGRSPSLREIGQGVGITSTSHISYHIHRLVRWCYLGRIPSTWRSLFLMQQGYEAIGKQPVDDLNVTVNELRDENRRLREWGEQLHRERDNLNSQIQSLMAQAG
jgi:SOS-response transcriptional repressor LexA